MKVAVVIALLIAAATQGCSVMIASTDHDATDLSTVNTGAMRGDIEKHLGPSKARCAFTMHGKDLRAATYRYDMGFEGITVAEGVGAYAYYTLETGILLPVLEPLWAAVILIGRNEKIKEQTRYLTVIYGSDDQAITIGRQSALEQDCAGSVAIARSHYRALAADKTGVATFGVAAKVALPPAFEMLCAAAQDGDAQAQTAIAKANSRGASPINTVDRALAYAWYRLAADQGNGWATAAATNLEEHDEDAVSAGTALLNDNGAAALPCSSP